MHRARLIAAGLLIVAADAHADGLRVATWNISFYSGGRVPAIQTSVYGEFDGRSMSPDAILLQEMISQSAVQQIVTALNTADNSPGDWVMAPFIDGNDSDNALVYRASKLEFLGAHVIAEGGLPPNHPRDVNRYDVRLKDYASDEAVLSLYSSHMKAGSGSDDQARRLLEAEAIRADAAALPSGRHFVLGGDFNIQSSFQAAYQELVTAPGAGRFRDPIATPGSWNNDHAYRFVHTQDPAGAGGMDDRHDQLLVSYTLTDGEGVDYIGLPAVAYSAFTWDDPNHSYRCWGNDGTSFDSTLRTDGNTMVGPEIAAALKAVCNGAGHLPVLLDLQVPARIAADPVIDFGTVLLDTPAAATLTVANAGDVALWGAGGIGGLVYALDAPPPFDAPEGPHEDDAGGGLNTHEVTLDTSVPGLYEELLLIPSNDPEAPLLAVVLRAEVVENCLADFNGDGTVNTLDFFGFLNAWAAGDAGADINGDASVNTLDFFEFLNAWAGGC